MNCEQAQYLLHAYADGELDLVNGLEVERHAAECSRCRLDLVQVQRLKNEIAGLYRQFPSGLGSEVRRSLRQLDSADRSFRPVSARTLAIAASVVGVLILGWLMIRFLPSRTSQSSIEGEVISSHIRSLMHPGHLLDVVSSDQHTVKPWFNGKLDFSPPVIDTAQSGFPLEGGRLDYLDGHPVAALVYGRRAHRVNVFIWPATGRNTSSRTEISKDGYNLIHWTSNGFNYWMVSDLEAGELRHLADLLGQPGQ